MRAWAVALAALSCVAASAPVGARAQVDPDGAASTTTPTPARSFAATTVDVGFLYFRPRLALGWGKPLYTWVGVEANPIFTSSGFGAYAGLRGALPFADLRVGARSYYPFEHSFFYPQPTYDRLDLQQRAGPHARYVSLEAEANVELPLGPGKVLALASATYVVGVPDGFHVFEETLRVVADPPWIFRGRLGYSLAFGPGNAFHLGVVGELLEMPGRNAFTVRAGLIASVRLYDDLEVRASFVPVIASTDSIGFAGADFAQLGLRYRWWTD